jgi:MFS family permease
MVAFPGRNAAGGEAKSLSFRASRWVAFSGCAFSLVLVALGLLLGAANGYEENEIEPYTVNLVVAALAFSTVGALVAARQRTNPIGWLLLGVGILYATELFMGNYGVFTLDTDPESLLGGTLAAWLASWAWIAGGSLVLFVFLYFPDGRLPSPRWRPVAWLVLISAALAVAPFAFGPGLLEGSSGGSRIVNPVGVEGSAKLRDLFERASLVLLVPVSVALISSFVVRFRRARGEERQQIKWVAYGVALFTLAIVVVSIWPSLDRSVVGNVLFLVGFLAIPSAMALAILKYRLYDIDVVINRTLVYGALSVTLALLYFGSIAVLQGAWIALTGQRSQLAVVASTLLIAALFNPVRHRIQAFIDRRFYRRKYDARKTLEAFSFKLRDETDLENLSGELVGVVEQTIQPAHVSLWLRDREERARMQKYR